MKVEEGSILIFDVMQWHDPLWQFGFPSICLRPVVRYYENGSHIDQIVEDICIEASLVGSLKEHKYDWWGYKLSTLKRRFSDAVKGKYFPTLQCQAKRVTVHFFKNEDGDLSWKEITK